jgi:hypothetical protein
MIHYAPLLILAALIGVFAWATDFITLEGERTVYTVECKQGTWNGDRCAGKLVAAERYRFRALKAHGEVLFWIIGSAEPSGHFTQCEIKDRGNWACKANTDSPRSITLAMSKGHPVPDLAANTRHFHAVSKVKWLLLHYGNVLRDIAGNPSIGTATGIARIAGFPALSTSHDRHLAYRHPTIS